MLFSYLIKQLFDKAGNQHQISVFNFHITVIQYTSKQNSLQIQMHTIHIRSFFLYLLNTMHRNPLFKHSCLQCMCVYAHARKNMLVSQCVTQEGREGRKDGLVSKGTCDSLGGCAHSHQTPQQRVTYILLLLHRKQKRNIIH